MAFVENTPENVTWTPCTGLFLLLVPELGVDQEMQFHRMNYTV